MIYMHVATIVVELEQIKVKQVEHSRVDKSGQLGCGLAKFSIGKFPV